MRDIVKIYKFSDLTLVVVDTSLLKKSKEWVWWCGRHRGEDGDDELLLSACFMHVNILPPLLARNWLWERKSQPPHTTTTTQTCKHVQCSFTADLKELMEKRKYIAFLNLASYASFTVQTFLFMHLLYWKNKLLI